MPESQKRLDPSYRSEAKDQYAPFSYKVYGEQKENKKEM